MLSFFRRLVRSRVGVIVTLGVLAIIALAFAAGDITGVRGTQPLTGGSVAEVGGSSFSEADLRSRAQTAFSAYRQQQPTLDMAGFVAGGGFTAVVDRTINGLALQEFANTVGMHAGKRAVDGEIASIPAFQGLNGQFSQQAYEAVLQQQRLTDKQVREDIGRDTLARHLIAPTLGASQVPAQLALPYASLLLERRRGAVGYIPIAALGTGPAPSAAEIQTFYTRQRARYTVPERRALRFAIVRAADVAAGAKPTDADIAAAYAKQRARFAATEKRTLVQVILADRAAAATLAGKVRSGTAIAAAARTAGLEPSTLAGVEKAAFAAASSPDAANAAFSAPRGGVVGPVRSPLGWSVIQVEAIETIAARTLDQARAELTAELTKTKGAQALADVQDKLNNAATENATFDEVVADARLTAQTTPPLLATGINPDVPPAQPDPLLARLTQAAFAAEQGDAPQLVQIDADGSFAVVAIGRIVPAAPRPLASIREAVIRDLLAERNLRAARTLAATVVAQVDRGLPLAQALARTNLRLPPIQPVNASRAELARGGGALPPPVALMFSMAPKRAKLLEAPNRSGWFVVHLDAIQSGSAAGNARLIASTRQGLGGVAGRELVEQFTAAVRAQIGVKRNEALIAKVRNELSGAAAPVN